jgi:hypothetical protein
MKFRYREECRLQGYTPYDSSKNRRFAETYSLHHHGDKNIILFLRCVLLLVVIADVVPRSPILVTLMMDAIYSSQTSVLTRATWRNIPEDDILHSQSRENFKSYIALTGWSL